MKKDHVLYAAAIIAESRLGGDFQRFRTKRTLGF
jgi:hypothetical protein